MQASSHSTAMTRANEVPPRCTRPSIGVLLNQSVACTRTYLHRDGRARSNILPNMLSRSKDLHLAPMRALSHALESPAHDVWRPTTVFSSPKRTAGNLRDRLAMTRRVPYLAHFPMTALAFRPLPTGPSPHPLDSLVIKCAVLGRTHRMSSLESYQRICLAYIRQIPSIIYIGHSFSCSTRRRHECAGSFKASSAGTSSPAALSITTFAHLQHAAAFAERQRTITRHAPHIRLCGHR
ncbi:uncharacterized protein LAESUDRAFT_216102 [Laetiporus sulphureus 93-53]|uniref:Uncharacterized protein n=1 Tax=Laetiporus sulphureus 93-53 TaxID=1314785 RepID=A0A165DWV0_9APHY|nr:uncharacterized protein LAESUDRAFT_216102 [Laetiporus sulphureus 93-53]KZT05793.1 hypothetical protein LAESUDRAFT_216102 [Laetiporus sulphureus 93-53]